VITHIVRLGIAIERYYDAEQVMQVGKICKPLPPNMSWRNIRMGI